MQEIIKNLKLMLEIRKLTHRFGDFFVNESLNEKNLYKFITDCYMIQFKDNIHITKTHFEAGISNWSIEYCNLVYSLVYYLMFNQNYIHEIQSYVSKLNYTIIKNDEILVSQWELYIEQFKSSLLCVLLNIINRGTEDFYPTWLIDKNELEPHMLKHNLSDAHKILIRIIVVQYKATIHKIKTYRMMNSCSNTNFVNTLMNFQKLFVLHTGKNVPKLDNMTQQEYDCFMVHFTNFSHECEFYGWCRHPTNSKVLEKLKIQLVSYNLSNMISSDHFQHRALCKLLKHIPIQSTKFTSIDPQYSFW